MTSPFVIIRRAFKSKKVPLRFINTRPFKSFNQEADLNDLGALDWTGVINAPNEDLAITESFNTNVLSTLSKHAPCVKRRVKGASPPWVNEEFVKVTKELNYLKENSI